MCVHQGPLCTVQYESYTQHDLVWSAHSLTGFPSTGSLEFNKLKVTHVPGFISYSTFTYLQCTSVQVHDSILLGAFLKAQLGLRLRLHVLCTQLAFNLHFGAARSLSRSPSRGLRKALGASMEVEMQGDLGISTWTYNVHVLILPPCSYQSL